MIMNCEKVWTWQEVDIFVEFGGTDQGQHIRSLLITFNLFRLELGTFKLKV